MLDKSEFINRVREALANSVIIGDGHTIFKPEFYSPYFTETELDEANLIQVFESDKSNYKATIFGDNGEIIESLKGVYNLSFLEWVCGRVGVTKQSQMEGRGSRASDYVKFINEIANPVKESV